MKKRFLAMLLALVMVLGLLPVSAGAVEAAADAVVYLTVSNQGALAADKDGKPMANREVTVKDLDANGTLSYDEALVAAHAAYNSTDGYSAPGGYVEKLWGTVSTNMLFAKNHVGLTSTVTTATVAAGDYLVASLNKDSTYWADWYTFFDSTTKQVAQNETFTLTLKGHLGMAYTPEELADVPLSGITAGTWSSGSFTSLGKTTDASGQVTLSFAETGTYYVTADGTVNDTVSDYSQPPYDDSATVNVNCPVIAPVCVVTVTEAQEEDNTMSDADAVALIYKEFSGGNENSYNATKTPLVFPLTYEGIQYTNVLAYLKAWAKKNTGRDVTINCTPTPYTTTYKEWSSGSQTNVSYTGMDLNTDITQGYFTNNAAKSMNQLKNVTFTVGSETSSNIANIYIKVDSLQRSPAEVVAYVKENLPFYRIQGANTSAESVTQQLGEASGSSKTLPNTTGLYNTTSVTITWAAENVSGKTDALSVNATRRTTTIVRPNVGEENAVFDLTATITSKTDTSVSDTVTHRVTIPAFEGITVPIQVTEGAALSLTDSYYGTSAAVDSKYIVKQENAPEGYDLYHCTLHLNATGGKQSFKYAITKEGCITSSGTISVTGSDMQTTVIDLVQSSEDDTKLESLSLTSPASGSADIVADLNFDPDVHEYNIEVQGVRSLKFAGAVKTEGATVKITSRYTSEANANSGTLTTTAASITSACYLPTAADTTAVIQITVTAPESTTQTEKTRVYTINVKKSTASGPLTALVVTPSASNGAGKKDEWAGEDGAAALEEALTPAFVSGSVSPKAYTVNYWRDQITVKPTAAGCTITVNGETVASGKTSSAISLNVGKNEIRIVVTDANNTVTLYSLTVYRKSRLDLTGIAIEGGALNRALVTDGSDRSTNGRFPYSAKTLKLTFDTNLETDSDVDVRVALGDNSYTGKAGEVIEVPVGDAASAMLYVWLYHTVDGIMESQVYIVNLSRMPSEAPSSVESYLPAPGQFVNQPSYQNVGATLTGNSTVTLGAFGGSVVYRYDSPILNDPANPYGIDFIVEGNAFTNSDGSSAVASGEPAAVMVSANGETWYELAGSEYYDAATIHGLTVTYTNPDTAFAGAADVPWTDSEGESGAVLKNGHHSQAYFPNPEFYNTYNTGVGKNSTYTAQSVSFTGSKTAGSVYPSFGYADNHAAGNYSGASSTCPTGSEAANPYIANHYMTYNADGFDLAWAVDENGDPVELESISYIKIYNPWLYDGGSTGEKSPEITQVLRAAASNSEVGVSKGLSTLTVNGKTVELTEGVYTYTVDGGGASSLTITPTAQNAEANIYVSNQRVVSGESSVPFTAVAKTRIIVQEGEKEPVIYILNFTGVATQENNADLNAVVLTPGDISKAPDSENEFSFSVESSISAVRLTPTAGYKKASMQLSGGSLTEAVTLTSGSESRALGLNVGDNVFTLDVTSSNGEVKKSYTITITRAEPSGSAQNTVTVTFSLTGDTLHYDYDTNSNTGRHTNPTWISATRVTVPAGSTVKYVTEMLLNNAGIDYVTSGIYVSEINGLAEKDNGPNSGWMFRHNTEIANEGYASRVLQNGDTVKWFYTDDYTKETGYEGGWDNINAGNSSVSTGSSTQDDSAKTEEKMPFTDVTGHWAEEAIAFVYSSKLMVGTAETVFSPNATLNRAMLVTILYRMEGSPAVSADNPYTDVAAGSWYTAAVIWGTENGIVTGYGNGSYGPMDNITREQMATMLLRYSAHKKYDTSTDSSLSGYTDKDDISSWAEDAMAWANGLEIITGRSETTLVPNGTATRGEAATILMRYLSKY